MDLLTTSLTWGLPSLSLTIRSYWLPWGRVSKPLASCVTPVTLQIRLVPKAGTHAHLHEMALEHDILHTGTLHCLSMKFLSLALLCQENVHYCGLHYCGTNVTFIHTP